MQSGEIVARYRIVEEIGRGSMGAVYKAQHVDTGRTVALKLIAAASLTEHEARARFDREVRAVSALSHPNICAMFEAGHWQDHPFLAMEFLQGAALADRMRSRTLTPAQSLRIAAPVAAALEAAHAAGILHRDIKPANIFLTSSGEVKVLDFGLAKIDRRRQAVAAEAATVVTFVTKPGMLLGTLAYMPPEQMRGEVLDGRADLYPLGVILHELCTGTLPVQGSIDPLPGGLDRVVTKLIAPDREHRYCDAGEARRAMEALLAAITPLAQHA